MANTANPWSYKIDYDKAIAEDERVLAMLDLVDAVGAYLPPGANPGGYLLTVATVMVVGDAFGLDREPMRAKLGLTEFDVNSLADAYSSYDKLPHPYPGAGSDWCRGNTLLTELDEKFMGHQLKTKEQIDAWRKAAKASLARHKRNKAKYGTATR